MRQPVIMFAVVAALSLSARVAVASPGDQENNRNRREDDQEDNRGQGKKSEQSVQLGPRPFFLVNNMEDSSLKQQLLKCTDGPFKKSDFSIGHRGAALQFPEHTRESYEAAVRMGAGIVECDGSNPVSGLLPGFDQLACGRMGDSSFRARGATASRHRPKATIFDRLAEPIFAIAALAGRIQALRH